MSVYKIYQVRDVKGKLSKEEVATVTADSFEENFEKYSFFDHKYTFFGNLKSREISGHYDSLVRTVVVRK